MKRLFEFDILFSLFGLTVLSPFLFGFAILIKKEGGGPVFYRGVRVGRDGKLFPFFKFRNDFGSSSRIRILKASEINPSSLLTFSSL